MKKHTVDTFAGELDTMFDTLCRLAAGAVRLLDRSVEALAARDAALCRAVIDEDVDLDALHHRILEAEQSILSRRQPVGVDLRQVVAMARMARDWERIGDHAKGIARVGLGTLEDPELPGIDSIRKLHRIAAAALSAVLHATETRDAERAREVWRRDDRIDEIYFGIFGALLGEMQRDPARVNAGARLLFVAKSLERCGDHATNIAEDVVYWRTGELIEIPHPRVEET
jgi:phosphate transport system protein